MRAALRTRHCSPRTEKAYVGRIRRYILFHGKRHPAEMGAEEITRFLSALAIERNVLVPRNASSTAPYKSLVVMIAPKGQPLAVPVKD